MTVVAIHVAAEHGAPVVPLASAEARAGMGLEGDRHFSPDGHADPGEALTLVEEEVVGEVGLPPGATRRQVTVRGVRLNELIGRRFRVGEVECYAVQICEPCLTLERNTRPGIIKDLVHRGGINADILTDGTIAVGDEVTTLDA
ncbi:MAG TPA: MOSC domain-containing protein [Actinomycetota bacterium]|nr:MOSC domain-containing protein [Actinomycetota bacterium]